MDKTVNFLNLHSQALGIFLVKTPESCTVSKHWVWKIILVLFLQNLVWAFICCTLTLFYLLSRARCWLRCWICWCFFSCFLVHLVFPEREIAGISHCHFTWNISHPFTPGAVEDEHHFGECFPLPLFNKNWFVLLWKILVTPACWNIKSTVVEIKATWATWGRRWYII